MYKKNERLAAEISVYFNPFLRPWNVKRALFGDTVESSLKNIPQVIPIKNLQCQTIKKFNFYHLDQHCIDKYDGDIIDSSPKNVVDEENNVEHQNNKFNKTMNTNHINCTDNLNNNSNDNDSNNNDSNIEVSEAFIAWQKSARKLYHNYLTLFMRIKRDKNDLNNDSSENLNNNGIIYHALDLNNSDLMNEWFQSTLYLYEECKRSIDDIHNNTDDNDDKYNNSSDNSNNNYDRIHTTHNDY